MSACLNPSNTCWNMSVLKVLDWQTDMASKLLAWPKTVHDDMVFCLSCEAIWVNYCYNPPVRLLPASHSFCVHKNMLPLYLSVFVHLTWFPENIILALITLNKYCQAILCGTWLLCWHCCFWNNRLSNLLQPAVLFSRCRIHGRGEFHVEHGDPHVIIPACTPAKCFTKIDHDFYKETSDVLKCRWLLLAKDTAEEPLFFFFFF